MEIPLLQQIVIILSLSVAVLLFCHSVRIPSLVGFILTGVLCGPHGFGFIRQVHDVQILADVGIILLLFTVGMEFSFRKILHYKRYFFVGGNLQVLFVMLAGIVAGKAFQRPWVESVFLGFILALSSTAIVLPTLEKTNQLRTPHGKLTVGILIFQDFIAVPMMLMLPVLAGATGKITPSLFLAIGQGLAILLLVTFLAVKILPRLLFQIAKTANKELFLLTIATVCFGIAFLTSSIGLSLSLGAFLAGLVVAESEFNHAAIGDILPFKEIFTSFFFVSIGMLFDVKFLFQYPLTIALLTVGVLLTKFFAAGLTTLVLGMSFRTAILVGLALCQIGEFSFVLAKTGFDLGLGSDYLYQLFLAVSLLTMSITPSLLYFSSHISDSGLALCTSFPIPKFLKERFNLSHKDLQNEQELSDHIVIVGFGLGGHRLAKAAKETKIQSIILDINPERVQEGRVNGESILFGDASQLPILEHAQIKTARVMAIVINDPIVALRIVKVVREINASIYIIARAQYLQEASLLYKFGASEVVTAELCTSTEILSRVLRKYEVEADRISNLIHQLRIEGYDVSHYHLFDPLAELKLNFKGSDIQIMELRPDSPLAGKTLAEINLRKVYGISVLLIKRKNHTISAPDANTAIELGDQIVVACANCDLTALSKHFNLRN